MTSRSIRVLVTLSLAAGLSAGCVSAAKYRALEARSMSEQAELQGQLFELQEKKRALERDKATLENENASLERDKSAVEAELTALRADKTTLEEDLAGLRKDKARIEEEVRTLNELLPRLERLAAEVSAKKDEEIRRLKGTYDELVEDLKGEIEQGEIKVTQIRDRLTVNLVEKVLFDSGHAEVKATGKSVLKKVGAILRDVTDKDIRIEGYTDSVPIGESLRKRFPTNWELSTQRATNVLRFLEEQADVSGAKLSAVGYGPFRPVADNATPEGRAQNRRIEIVLVPQDVQEVFDAVR